MPADSLRKIEKGCSWEVDTLIMDLEDGVAQNRKEEARATRWRRRWRRWRLAAVERLVRVNPLSTGRWRGEIAATVAGRPDGYIMPKAEDPHDLRTLDQMLAIAEREARATRTQSAPVCND